MNLSEEQILQIVRLHQQYNDPEFTDKVMEKFPDLSPEMVEFINKLIVITLNEVTDFFKDLVQLSEQELLFKGIIDEK